MTCCHYVPKLVGSVGVLMTAYGFLLMSGAFLLQEGLMGIAAQAIWNVQSLRWGERLLLKALLPFFEIIGVIRKRDPYYDSDVTVRQREDRRVEIRTLFGGGLILLGSVLQALAYWL